MQNHLQRLRKHVLLLALDAGVTCPVASSAVCWCLISYCFILYNDIIILYLFFCST
jgi:hypothetical protein